MAVSRRSRYGTVRRRRRTVRKSTASRSTKVGRVAKLSNMSAGCRRYVKSKLGSRKLSRATRASIIRSSVKSWKRMSKTRKAAYSKRGRVSTRSRRRSTKRSRRTRTKRRRSTKRSRRSSKKSRRSTMKRPKVSTMSKSLKKYIRTKSGKKNLSKVSTKMLRKLVALWRRMSAKSKAKYSVRSTRKSTRRKSTRRKSTRRKSTRRKSTRKRRRSRRRSRPRTRRVRRTRTRRTKTRRTRRTVRRR